MPRPTPGATRPHPPLGHLYGVSGRRLMLHRSGEGGPAVVFLPGAGLVGLDYLNIHNRVAEATTSVLYDRAGTGWSDAAALPRPAADVTAELHALLRAAGVPGPYVLVGHSLGGAYARHFAHRHPADVAGLLLLDPFHEDLHGLAPQEARERLTELHRMDIPDLTPHQLDQARSQAAPLFAQWPDSVREALVEHHATAAWKAGLYEDRNLYDEVAEELRTAQALPDIPLIVVTAQGHDDAQAQLWSDDVLRWINATKSDLHGRLASSVPRGEHRTLPDAGHGWLHEESQDDVLQAVLTLLARP
ncbi:alpha/beta hydrolase [Streptomyces sp. NBC_01460]|uniref:alpha/beta hydrolase n=1 Tax=Streptomyces sp. NBC_01460 TaxID=2903875 RepID=UPI002E31F8FD|nr:alpha/beta hydrolase [Streptomyces sp. NBC_01460]